MSTHYDAIVLGTGGVGSAALMHLASRGLKVLGLDRFPPGHDRGSSHGETRLIRLSYFEHPDYVPLLQRAYALWDALDLTLLNRCGVLYVGAPGSEIISGIYTAAGRYSLALEDADSHRFGSYIIPDGFEAVFEPEAGVLPVEQCVLAHLARAGELGAEHRHGLSVTGWSEHAEGVSVETDAGSFSADRLVISAGAWAGELLEQLQLPLTVLKKHLHWYKTDAPSLDYGFFFELGARQFYGFPAADGCLKVAEHSGGEEVTDPLAKDDSLDPEDAAAVEDFLTRHLPGVSLERARHATCYYTMTPDAQFIVDRVPGSERVAFAAGLSGHGFKFTPVLGEVLADLVTDGHTGFDLGFLSASRFT